MSNALSPSDTNLASNVQVKQQVILISQPVSEAQLVERLKEKYQISCAASTEEGLLLLSQLNSQIVLIESSMLAPSIQEEILKSEHKGIVLSATPSFEQGVQLIQQGYKGYGNIHSHSERLNAAINLVITGDVWLGASIVEGLKSSTQIPKETIKIQGQVNQLTPKEQHVAKEVTLGKSNKDIALTLSMSERTVKAHLSSIYQKLSLKNRTELLLNYKNVF